MQWLAPWPQFCYTRGMSTEATEATDAIEQWTNEQIIEAAARGELSEAQIDELFERDPELAKLALIATMQAIRQLRGGEGANGSGESHPSTPPGQQPVYTKPNRRKKRGRKRGAKHGHTGHSRPHPDRIDRHEEHPPLSQCPCCGGGVQPPRKHRKRIIVDLPRDLSTETTEHTIPRQWCGGCRKYVEPTVPDAEPNATLGHGAVASTAWYHYELGITVDQVIRIFGNQLNTRLSAGPPKAERRCGSGWRGRWSLGMSRSVIRRKPRPTCTPMRPAGGSTGRRTGSGASPTGGAATT